MRYFIHVARAGSFSRASTELHIAQPALSRQLRKLEEELGVDLLVRYGKGVRLTSAGSRLFEHARAIFQQVEHASQDVRNERAGIRGHAVLGLPPTSALLIAPPLYQDFRKLFPEATLQFREGLSSPMEEWLLDGRVDIALLYNSSALDSIESLPVLREQMVVVAPPQADLLAVHNIVPPLRMRDIAKLPLILPSLPHSNRRFLEAVQVRHGVKFNVVLEIDSIPLTKVMVQRGYGFAVLTHASVQEELARGELLAYEIESPPLVSTISIAILRQPQPTRLVVELIGLLQRTIARLVAEGAWQKSRMVDQ